MNITFLTCLLIVLDAWRLASLVANEDGPFDIFCRFRSAVRLCRIRRIRPLLKTFYKGLCCEWCNSVWFGALLGAAWWYFGEVVFFVTAPLWVSAGAIGFKYLIHVLKNADEYYHQLAENQKQSGAYLKSMMNRANFMRSWMETPGYPRGPEQ